MKTKHIKLPRMTDWLLITLVLLFIIYQVAPQQLPLSLYKLSLITMAAVIGYWVDRSAFPYARPDAFMAQPFSIGGPFVPSQSVVPSQQLVFCAAMIRRAIIIGAAMLAVSLGI